jgi:hypothetical protein
MIDPLSTFRDNVVHRVWLQSNKGPVIMNLSKAKSTDAITQEPVSTEDLTKKIEEVVDACLRLMPHGLTQKQWDVIPRQHRDLMHAPWLKTQP